MKKNIDKAKQAWDNASPLEKKAAVDQAKQAINRLADQVKAPAKSAAAANTPQPQPASPQSTGAPSGAQTTVSQSAAVQQAKQALSPLADMINATEAQMKDPVQAAKTAPVVSASAGESAGAKADNAAIAPAAAPKGYITIPVNAPKTMSEAAQ